MDHKILCYNLGQRKVCEGPWRAQQVHSTLHWEHGAGVWPVPAVWREEAAFHQRGAVGHETPPQSNRKSKVSGTLNITRFSTDGVMSNTNNFLFSYSFATVYRELELTVTSASPQEDLKWFFNIHGPGMQMNWPHFEVEKYHSLITPAAISAENIVLSAL